MQTQKETETGDIHIGDSDRLHKKGDRDRIHKKGRLSHDAETGYRDRIEKRERESD